MTKTEKIRRGLIRLVTQHPPPSVVYLLSRWLAIILATALCIRHVFPMATKYTWNKTDRTIVYFEVWS